MTKLRLLFSILSLSIIFFSCDGGEEVEPLDVQASMLGTYTGKRFYPFKLPDGSNPTLADTFDIVVTKGKDTKTMIFTETAASLKQTLYRYEVTIETESRNGATFTIAGQNFQGEPLQGENLTSSSPNVHGIYLIDEKTSKESIDFILRIINDGQAAKAASYEYYFDKI